MGRGKLVFKGEEKAKKARKSNSKKSSLLSGISSSGADNGGHLHDADNSIQQPPPPAAAAAAHAQIPSDQPPQPSSSYSLPPPKITFGQGLITTSGTVVTGHSTSFHTQLYPGDAILALVNNQQQMRVITMVLSPISISISSPFTYDLKTPTEYSFVNRPRDHKREREVKRMKDLKEKEDVERNAMGTYGKKGEIVYREKTEHGGYRIRREAVRGGEDLSRSDLLAVRTKKKSDRYC